MYTCFLFLVWVLLLSLIVLRITCVIACINSVTLYIAEYYSIVRMSQFLHSLVDSHLHYFQCVSITNKAAVNIPVCPCMLICFLLCKYLERNG